MGWSGVIFQLSVIVGCIAVFLTSSFFHDQRETLLKLLSTCPMHWYTMLDNTGGSLDANSIVRSDVGRIMSPDELALYDGSDGSRGLYVAVLGSVYDVSAGRKHYGPGGSYSFFAAKDASRAFVSGDFTESGLTSDISDLTSPQWLDLLHWFHFYEKTYIYVGKVIGNFYDDRGEPTSALRAAQDAINIALAAKQLEAEQQKIFPPCNSHWSDADGTTVWCSNKSGGVDRDWAGVPRLFFDASQQLTKCVCVRTTGPPSDKTLPDSGHGDLDHPNLREYVGCLPLSDTCSVQQ